MTSIIDSGLRTQDSGLRANYAQIKFEEFDHERLDEIYDVVKLYSDMQRNERYFLNGMIRYLKPAKILEVGVSHGGGSAIILNAIRDLPSRLISVDYCEKYYGGGTDKLSGYIVDEKFSHLKDKWTIYRGGDISRFIERVGGDIDLLVLDTAHIHPWETLNFLCVLPFMKIGSWVILHDVSLPYCNHREEDLACRYLYGHVVSDVKIMPAPEENYIPYFSNIGAFHVVDDTVKYVGNLFESLLCPWAALPGVLDERVYSFFQPILQEDLDDIRKVIGKYYPEYAEFLEHAIEFQKGIAKHKVDYYHNWRSVWRRNFPWTFKAAKFVKGLPGETKKALRKKFPVQYKKLRRIKRRLMRQEDTE